jgi:hypothetical protein
MLIHGHLTLTSKKLRALTEVLDEATPPGRTQARIDAVLVTEVDGVEENLRDVTSFGKEHSPALLRFVTKCQVANHYVRMKYFGWNPEVPLGIQWEQGQRDAWQELAAESERLLKVVKEIADKVPAH